MTSIRIPPEWIVASSLWASMVSDASAQRATLTVVRAGSRMVSLSWTVSGAVRLERKESEGRWRLAASCPKGTTDFTDLGLTQGREYAYRASWGVPPRAVYSRVVTATTGRPGRSRGRTEYFVDAARGNDAWAGTSPGTAWRTLDRVNELRYAAGDRIRFAVGQAFAGTFRIDRASSGTAGAWVELSTTGTGSATILAGDGDGITVSQAGWVRIADLAIVGAGRLTGNRQGRGILVDRSHDVTVERVTVTGFQRAGVEIRQGATVLLDGVTARENGYAGITATGTRLTIRRCRALDNPGDPTIRDNHSGNGIVVEGGEDSLVELCEAAGNGWDQPRGGQPNGPVGIWCHDAARITIQSCLSHDNRSTSGDGGGFDFDGGTRDSVLQYNYAYGNQSSGFLVWEYGSAFPLANNVIRWNVSVDDGEAGIRIGQSGGQGVHGLRIYQNTVWNEKVPCLWVQTGGVGGVACWNNLFAGPRASDLLRFGDGVRLAGNAYWAFDGATGFLGSTGFESWRTGTGQEQVGALLCGVFADPRLQNAEGTRRLTDPAGLRSLLELAPRPESPLKGRGLDLRSLFGEDPGPRDFLGSPTAAGAPDIGAVQDSSRP